MLMPALIVIFAAQAKPGLPAGAVHGLNARGRDQENLLDSVSLTS
jgi:hypothetical protein